MPISEIVKTCASCNNALPNPSSEGQVICILNPPTPVVLNVSRTAEGGAINGIEQIAVFPVMDKRSVCRKWQAMEQIELSEAPK